jgi:hypothetical protein
MKLAIGYHVQDGPWGGGNAFARSLADAAATRGDTVVYDLADPDIDLILMTDPRAHSPNISFGPGAILRYLTLRNPRAVVVHRINECDERKGTRRMNGLLSRANYAADHTVLIASWLKDLAVWRNEAPHSVILNGADTRIFRPDPANDWDGTSSLKLVTHHWGGNRLKGFDIYETLDRLIDDPAWRGRLAFSYVGNLPQGVPLAHSRTVAPLSGAPLAAEIASHHVYVTGSVNEPAGMHHVEGALCGLPLLFRRSGALPEYCSDFGFGFDDAEGFVAALKRMFDEYPRLRAKMPEYANTATRMCGQYLELFDDLLARRDEIVAHRRLWRSPWLVLRNQIPF